MSRRPLTTRQQAAAALAALLEKRNETIQASEAASRIRVTVETVRLYVKAGLLPAERIRFSAISAEASASERRKRASQLDGALPPRPPGTEDGYEPCAFPRCWRPVVYRETGLCSLCESLRRAETARPPRFLGVPSPTSGGGR